MTTEGNDPSQEEPGFTFHDKRRIDPNTGEVRGESAEADSVPAAESAADAAEETASDAADASDLGVEIPDDASELDSAAAAPSADAAEHLADLQRINAEYAAYRMRADRERERAALGGTIKAVEALIPVLDEIKLARENGDVTGPFEAHVNKLLDSLSKIGVEQYGEVGDDFDPVLHEALMQQPSDEVDEPTVFLVMQPGYRLGDRIIRAARVGVQQPED